MQAGNSIFFIFSLYCFLGMMLRDREGVATGGYPLGSISRIPRPSEFRQELFQWLSPVWVERSSSLPAIPRWPFGPLDWKDFPNDRLARRPLIVAPETWREASPGPRPTGENHFDSR